MKERFSKMLWTGVLSVLLGTSMSTVSADQVVGWDKGPNNYSYDGCCDYGWDRCANAYWYDQGGMGCCCNDPCFSIAADWLYWNTVQEDVDVGLANSDIVLGNSETKFFETRYKSGFRIAASYHLPCENVSLDFVYTYFHPRYSNRFNPPLGGSITGFVFPGTTVVSASEVSASFRLKYDMYDLLLSKVISCGECAKIRPYVGFRALWLREDWNYSFFSPGVISTAVWRFNFPAYGATLGAEGKWHICNNVSFIGRLGVSLLGGNPKHHNGWGALSEHRKHSQVISGWDGYVGFAYDTTCCCWPVDFAIGYEFQDWWNTPQRPRFVGVAGNQVTGDSASRLTLHGLFVRGGVSF